MSGRGHSFSGKKLGIRSFPVINRKLMEKIGTGYFTRRGGVRDPLIIFGSVCDWERRKKRRLSWGGTPVVHCGKSEISRGGKGLPSGREG